MILYTAKLSNSFLKFQPEGLLPQVGGALSLFLGIAIIMAFEIIELWGDLLMALFKYCTGSTKKNKL